MPSFWPMSCAALLQIKLYVCLSDYSKLLLCEVFLYLLL